MKTNCYMMTFFDDNVIPFIRSGIPVTMEDDQLIINGLGKYTVFRDPVEITKNDNIEENFKDYNTIAPWVTKEKDGNLYLYKMYLNENSLNLSEDNEGYSYVKISAKENERITVLNGRLFFRTFTDGKQEAIIRLKEWTMIKIEKEEGIVMVEYIDGNFICR